jgi:hypothetical protein
MGAVNTTYTFTPTDTITSTKMNNIIDETVMTSDAVLGGSGGSGGLDISSGKLSISANAINSSRLAANSVSSSNIVDGTIVNADISPTAGIAGTKIVSQFGSQNITATGDIGLEGTASDYTVVTCNNTSGVQVQLNANGNTEGNVRTTTNHPLTLSTNNTERMRISAAGNVGVGTSSPSYLLDVSGTGFPTAKVASTYTASGKTYSSLVMGACTGTNTGVQTGFVTDSSSPSNSFYHVTPWGGTEGFNFKLSSSGRVGISVAGEPSSTLQVGGTVTATAFAGPLTGNVTGNASTATTAASCSGNSATATLATKASTLSQGGGNGTAMTFNWNGQGGQPTWLWGGNDGVNHYVYNPSNFSVNYANSAGSAGSATTASTVSNGAITAAKLNGGQSGSAPVYGVRAWVNFVGRGTNGNCTIRSAGNVSSVSRTNPGKYTVFFSIPMQGTNYTVISSSGSSPGSPRFSCADRTTASTGSIEIETDNISGSGDDFNENNVMVME